MTRIKTLVSVAVASVALAGCFGGGDGAATPPADPLAAVPDSATQSVSGTVDYLNVLSLNVSDSREPIDVTAIVLPTSDDTEPTALN